MKMFVNLENALNAEGKSLSQQIADALPKASGELARSIQYKLNDEGTAIELEIDSADYFKYVDEGRAPGAFPPMSDIIAWTRTKNIPIEAAFPIARKIAEEGTEGVHVLDKVNVNETSIAQRMDQPAAEDLDAIYQKMLQDIFK